MARVHHETRIPQRLHARVLEAGQAARARAAARERRELVVDGLRLGAVVAVGLGPEGAAGEGALEEARSCRLACACDGLGDYGAASCGLAPDGDGVWVAAEVGDVLFRPLLRCVSWFGYLICFFAGPQVMSGS